MGVWTVVKVLLGVAAGAYVLAVLWLYVVQGSVVFQPTVGGGPEPSAAGLDFQDLRLGPDGVVHGWFVPGPADGPVVLFCHGNAGNMSHRLDTLRLLHGLGAGVLIFDYQGYGLSGGSPSEEGTARDARAAWDWLLGQGVAPRRIVLMGRSLGGAVAARLASELCARPLRDRPAGLILESTFTSVPDMGQAMYPFLPVRLLSRFSYDTLSLMPGLRLPVLVAHSPNDEMVPPSMGRALYDAAPGPKRFVALTGGHNGGWMAAGPAYAQALSDVLRHAAGAEDSAAMENSTN